jgi:hypothetical protein
MAAAIWAGVGGAGVVLPLLPDGAPLPLPEVGLLPPFAPEPVLGGVDDEGWEPAPPVGFAGPAWLIPLGELLGSPKAEVSALTVALVFDTGVVAGLAGLGALATSWAATLGL